MRQTITISIPKNIKKALDHLVSEEGVSRSDVVRDSLRDYLFVHQFRSLRSKMMTQAREKGIYTDEDVFNKVS
ncbi:MAG: CopG family transcriptional regulator [Chlamydiae bacterium]|nr:CopG family transcriptional regulator [Chlamydiota bacterium]MBI3277124.1 CopG family transcriptional regulator [Chlamydiota bacterium]